MYGWRLNRSPSVHDVFVYKFIIILSLLLLLFRFIPSRASNIYNGLVTHKHDDTI